MAVIEAADSGVLLRVRVQPRARTDRLEGVHGEQLRVRLTAPPVDGAANTACIAFLAKALGVTRSRVRIRSGAKSRDKLIHITGLTLEHVATILGIPLS
ncbi:MAG: DUF167 domain-containing protein [Candidatus Tectomicrobia bacterium]|nr:DUF167 domain-containing protein [Candidatus Tectomicrobia bacterium]